MESLTKNRQDAVTLERMAERYFAPATILRCRELTEGYFNVAYDICLSDGRDVILKVAPPKQVRIMTYEKNIMHSEVEAMRMASGIPGIPVAKVLGFDESGEICESPYLFMEKLAGRPLNSVKHSLNGQQLQEIYLEAGQIIRQVNSIPCPCFGLPGQEEYQGGEWFPVFRKMMEAGLADAAAGQVDLQIPVDRLRELLDRDEYLFREVDSPCLVHWDCWDGNILVEEGRITGLIDWERCLWGDPLMEANFRTYDNNIWFMKGYGMERLEPNQYRRALWYDVYLTLLISLECEYRKYDTMHMYEWATGILTEQFARLLTA